MAARIGDAAPAAAPSLSVRAIDWPCCAAPSILHAWNTLAQFAIEPNPFHESWYLLPALRGLDTDETVQMLLFEAGDMLAGMIPIAREPRYYGRRIPHLGSWTHPNCFLGAPLVAPGFERAFWRVLLEWADARTGNALFLHLSDLPLHGPLFEALTSELAEQARDFGIVYREERALLETEQTPEEYFTDSLSGKQRSELRRKLARLSEQGKVAFVRQSDGEALNSWIDAFLTLEGAGWKGITKSSLNSLSTTSTLFREALLGAAAQRKLQRRSLTLDDRPIAMMTSFLTPPGAFGYKCAFDEAYARYSPGMLLQCENLLILDRQDIRWFDSCCAPDNAMINHLWRERRAIGRISIAIGGSLRRACFRHLLKSELGRHSRGARR